MNLVCKEEFKKENYKKENFKKEKRMAAIGGLLLFLLMCVGCGRAEEVILIGTTGEVFSKEPSFSQTERAESLNLLLLGDGTASNRWGMVQEKNSQAKGKAEGQYDFEKGQIEEQWQSEEMVWPEGEQAPETRNGETEEITFIRVYVCGAVAKPGVVSVPKGSRVEDALAEAGGFAPEAMRQALNLADWVMDGQMLYFPAEGEEWDGMTSGNLSGYGGGFTTGQEAGMSGGKNANAGWDTGGNQAGGGNQESERVNINTADAAELMTLPGIGESRARDIIAYREKNGSFTSCEDIMKVSGIKTSVYEKINDKIRVK